MLRDNLNKCKLWHDFKQLFEYIVGWNMYYILVISMHTPSCDLWLNYKHTASKMELVKFGFDLP